MKKFLIAFALVALASSPAHADITWALAGPYTGNVAGWGLSAQAGTKQAVEDINAAGGVNGQKIVLKIYDDACDPKQAVTVANKIISENIHFALHGSCSAASLATTKTYVDEGTVIVNNFSSNPKLTDEGGPHIFRTIYRDDNAAKVLAAYILKNYSKKKLAIIHDKSAYGQGIAEYVRDLLNKGGMKEIVFEPYDPDNHDYTVLVTRLKSAGAEVLFAGGYPVEIGTIVRQLREAKSNIQVVAGDLSAPDFWKIAGPAGEGTLFAFTHDPRKAPGAKDVIAKLEKSGTVVDGYTLYGYVSAQVLAQAMAKAGNDPARVADVLHKDTFDTILGKWSFDRKGDPTTLEQVMFHWHNGEYAEIE